MKTTESKYQKPKEHKPYEKLHAHFVNIVAIGSFGRALDIKSLYIKLDVEERVYAPETYPALLVKVKGKKKHVTLFIEMGNTSLQVLNQRNPRNR